MNPLYYGHQKSLNDARNVQNFIFDTKISNIYLLHVKAPRHSILCGEFIVGRRIPRTKGQ